MRQSPHALVALLPMKAHSERVKSKNSPAICPGKPLYRWILDTLLSLPEIDPIVINTDARGLLRESGLESGGRILLRDRAPPLCGDHVSMNLILADDVAEVASDTYLMTHTTNPLLRAATIRDALATFTRARVDSRADSLFTVKKYLTRFYRPDGSSVNHNPKNLVRTQDLEPWFEENSNLYILRPTALRRPTLVSVRSHCCLRPGKQSPATSTTAKIGISPSRSPCVGHSSDKRPGGCSRNSSANCQSQVFTNSPRSLHEFRWKKT